MISTLQMASLHAEGPITGQRLRALTSTIRDTSMSTGIFDVWTAVFAMKAPSNGDNEVRPGQGTCVSFSVNHVPVKFCVCACCKAFRSGQEYQHWSK